MRTKRKDTETAVNGHASKKKTTAPERDVFTEYALQVWLGMYAEPKTIVSAWKFEGLKCQCPSVFSKLLFIGMSGVQEIPRELKSMIRYSKECDPLRSEYASIQELQLFIERPFERFYSIPETVSIVISLMSTEGWLPWM